MIEANADRTAVSGGFSIYGMIFTGALYPVIGRDIALELGKLSAVAWLERSSASWALKLSLTVLVAALMMLTPWGVSVT